MKVSRKFMKVVFCAGLLASFTVFAQEVADSAAAQPNTEEVAAPEAKKTTLMQMIKDGGWAMIPLGIFSVLTMYFVIQNGLSLREKLLLRPDLLPDFIQLMKDKKVVEAHTLCKENETLFTYVLAAGLERCGRSGKINFEKVKEAIGEASTEEMTSYMKPIDYLSIIGATAPMIGLLGTVSGMIKAFATIGSTGMGKPELLASNIGEALVTTATGLIIAIPAMLFYYFFRNNFVKSMASLGRNIGALLDTLETGELPLGFEDMGK